MTGLTSSFSCIVPTNGKPSTVLAIIVIIAMAPVSVFYPRRS
jgi:hypothetical protein